MRIAERFALLIASVVILALAAVVAPSLLGADRVAAIDARSEERRVGKECRL